MFKLAKENRYIYLTSIISLSVILFLPLVSHAMEINGKVGLSSLFFHNSPLYESQHQQQWSLFSEVEFYHNWNEDQDSLLLKPYIRLDQHDQKRSHFDIRELMWLHIGDGWELRTGISKVFWGVNEANHLVDIINQDDQVDDISGDPKLGQPMINLSMIKEWGVVNIFILPGFRERTFPGKEGRLRGPFIVDSNNAEYESNAANKHVDFALRWAHTFDDYDIGLHYFQGTNRDPRFIIQQDSFGEVILRPYYEQIKQVGLDFQATIESWLWKLEAIHRKDQLEKFAAISGGFEYTFVGIFESATDLGLIMEYSWDERDNPNITLFQNDIMIGSRFAFNDAQSTEILAGLVQDLDHSQLRSFQIEASRRLGKDWKLNLEIRLFSDKDLNPMSEDDHLQITLEKYF
jgi:hypothetical protein